MAKHGEHASEADHHRRMAAEHDQAAEHWAARGHLSYAADHRDAAVEEREVAEAGGRAPLPEMRDRIDTLRQRER